MRKTNILEQAIKSKNYNNCNEYFLLAYYNARENDHETLIIQDARCMRDIKEIIKNSSEFKINDLMIPTDFPNLVNILNTFTNAGFKIAGITSTKIKVIPIVQEEIFKPVIVLRR